MKMRRMRRTIPTALFALLLTVGPTSWSQDQNSTGKFQFDSHFFGTLKWRSIGPNRGGRSLSVTGSPGRPLEYYFGATGGGLWKTTDGGLSWTPATDGQILSSSVGAVAVAETNPDIVYLGMGETQLRGSIMQGDGVYRSSDAGKTWRHIGLKDTQAIARIRVHPTNPDVVYVAALGHPYGENEERGVFRSTDGGNTWKKVLHVGPRAGATDLVIDRTNPKVLYASTWQVNRTPWKMWDGGEGSKLFKSVDGGDNWIELTANPGMPKGPIGAIGIAVSPVDPTRLWAIVEANDGGVFRSDDAGWTWKLVNDERKLRQRAFYYSRIYADTVDRDTVYGANVGFFKSSDGGRTFQTLSPPHGDNHDLWIDPNNPLRMIEANDGGANVTLNGGKTWTDQAFSTAQLYHVIATTDVPYHVAGAQQDNSTVVVPSKGWENRLANGPNHGWYYEVGGGESGYIAQSPTDPDLFYAGSQGALITEYNRSNGQIRDIQVYPRFFSGEPASALPERWQWTFPIVFSPVDPKVLYACSQHVWKTTNDGQSWERISPDLTYHDPQTLGPSGGPITMDMNGPEIYATVFALAPSYHDVNTIWAGSDDGMVSLTRDGGKSWQNVTPPDMSKFTRVSIIDASRHEPGAAYVAANRYQMDDFAPLVWRTHDFGKTWTKITRGIKTEHFVRVIREDPVRPGLLYLGTEHGIYVSFNDGETWQPLQQNLPDTQVADLVVKNSDLVIATHGRGFWLLENINPLRQLTEKLAKADVILFKPSDAMRGVDDAVIQYCLSRPAESVKIEILDAVGKTIQSFTGTEPEQKSAAPPPRRRFGRGGQSKPTTAAGLNQFAWSLRYPAATGFEGMILWGAGAERGPTAPPGRYQVRLTVGDYSHTEGFQLRMNPNLKGITQDDLASQFDLAIKIRDELTAANKGVIQIRDVRQQIESRLKASGERELADTAKALLEKMQNIEENLYQVRNRSEQDPLNFPIKLNNRIAALGRSVETGDNRPTDASYKVFKELSGELAGHLKALRGVLSVDLAPLNALLKEKKLAAIEIREPKDETPGTRPARDGDDEDES
jgi:photosystem II stability/assembly factor-like uncharacterized protein